MTDLFAPLRRKKARDGEPLAFLLSAFHTKTDGCIFWPFARKTHGQGALWLDGKLQIASNVVCQWVHGPKSDDILHAAHSCGNGHLACVNPRHVSWKTPIENQRDRLDHGTDNRGVKHGMVVLTEAQVDYIFATKGIIPNRKIAVIFGVSQATVSDIRTGRTWAHRASGGVLSQGT